MSLTVKSSSRPHSSMTSAATWWNIRVLNFLYTRINKAKKWRHTTCLENIAGNYPWCFPNIKCSLLRWYCTFKIRFWSIVVFGHKLNYYWRLQLWFNAFWHFDVFFGCFFSSYLARSCSNSDLKSSCLECLSDFQQNRLN